MKQLLTLSAICLLLVACNDRQAARQAPAKDISYNDTAAAVKETIAEPELPFVGKRSFETRPGVAGTGTPHKYIEILANRDVYFSFEQENQADGTVTSERYYAGKFQRYLKSVFKEWDNETTYYEITKEKIYEVDQNNKRITSDDCCSMDNDDLKDKCPCESELTQEEGKE